METPFPAPLTAEQLAAIHAGGAFAQCEDPNTHVHYHLIPYQPPTLDDDYVRERIEEAFATAGDEGFPPLDMSEIKMELQRRLDARKLSSQ